MLPRVSHVEPCPDYMLIITFKNGERKKYDVKPILELQLPMFRNLAKVFMAARTEHGTVTWPGNMDLDTDSLYLNSTEI